MASLTFKGADDFADKLLALGEESAKIAKHALYEGAGTVADALRAAVESLPEGTPKGNSPSGHPFEGLTREDKEDLLNGLGVARFEEGHNSVSTAISFSGYARRTEKNHPNGVPLALIARSMESGSSVRKKHPFVRPTVNRIKQQAVDAMARTANDDIQNAMR